MCIREVMPMADQHVWSGLLRSHSATGATVMHLFSADCSERYGTFPPVSRPKHYPIRISINYLEVQPQSK